MSFVSYAQNYEDVMLIRALHGIERGFYIDVGAQDPVDDSVTKAFYELGWRGINIEPVTHWFQRLVADRPHDINLQIAVSDSPGQLHLFEVEDSGLSTTDPDFAARHAHAGHQIRESDVPCVTLDEICNVHGVGDVHFLKIDCEGGEAATLRGFSLKRIRPWVILLEATEPNSQKPAYMEWEPLLTGRGYHFVYEDGLNRFYVADEHIELDQAFFYPPNVFDYFVRAPEAALRRQLEVAQGDLLVMREAQRVIRAESECEQLRASAEHLRGENERREAALVEHRQLLAEAGEREAQGVARTQAEHEQLRADIEYLRSENERREAALVEHRRLLDEAAGREAQRVARWQAENERREAVLDEYRRLLAEAEERETQGVARTQAEHEQLRADIEYLRSENERREVALVEHRHLLNEAAEREAQSVARLQAEIERRDAVLAGHRRLLDELVEREAQSVERARTERAQWRTDIEYLRSENQRRELILVEQQQTIASLETRLAASAQDLAAASEHAMSLAGERARQEADLALLRIDIDGSAAQVSRLQMEVGRLHHEVLSRDREVARLHALIQMIQGSISWRVTFPLRLAKRGASALVSGVFLVGYHLLRWPARLVRPLIRWMARWPWLRSLAVRMVGVDSRLTKHARLFLFGPAPDVQAAEQPDMVQSSVRLTRRAVQMLEEIQDVRRKRLHANSWSKSGRK